MKKLQYILPICLSLSFCKTKDVPAEIKQVDIAIQQQTHLSDSVRKQQDIVIEKGDKVATKIKKSSKVSKLLPSTSILPSTGKIAKIGGKVVQDSSTYDSMRVVLIQKEKDCDSCVKVVETLKQTIQSERDIMDALVSSLNKKSDILNDSIASMTKQHKKDLRKAQWKGAKKGFLAVILVVASIFVIANLQ